MSDLWHQLQTEHDRIWELLNLLTTDTAQLPDAGNDPKRQRRAALDLVRLQSGHEITEHHIIWAVVRDRCPGGAKMAAEATEHEHKIRLTLHDLAHIKPPAPDFTVCVHALASLARTHFSYEQNRVWPLLADTLDPTETAELLHAWTTVRPQAPTRPHPHLPADPRITRLAGAALPLSIASATSCT
jgi:hypothetical protein